MWSCLSPNMSLRMAATQGELSRVSRRPEIYALEMGSVSSMFVYVPVFRTIWKSIRLVGCPIDQSSESPISFRSYGQETPFSDQKLASGIGDSELCYRHDLPVRRFQLTPFLDRTKASATHPPFFNAISQRAWATFQTTSGGPIGG